MNTVVEYLSKRLGKVVLNTKKAQAQGPLMLATMLMQGDDIYEEDLIPLVSIALNIILHKTANDPSGKKGEALLTHTAVSIGTEVSNVLKYKLSKIHMLHVGDLFVEAFYHAGLLNVEIQEGFAPKSGSPYVITITDKFQDMVRTQPAKDLLLYTTDTKIPDIKNVIQGNNFAVIKGINCETHKQPLIIHQQEFKESINRNDKWVQSTNKLQQQGWKINQKVLDVITLNLPSILPEKKERLNKYGKADVNNAYRALQKDPSEENKQAYNEAAEKWNQELSVLRDISKRAELETIYRKAVALRDYEVFYQYVDLDYRGRVYYKEPFFNFQGSDMARAMFLFEEGERITASGLKWLYIHAASCYNQSYDINEIPNWCSYDYKKYLEDEGLESISVDKMTLEDRQEWCKANMDLILESTNKILDCEKPFSFLACCIEINEFWKDPDYQSHLPIPIDGSCNGYQHSAAISKDEKTGKLVSLMPTEIQSDLYVKAAKVLIEFMPDWFADRPDLKLKHIRKYITKRGVMTRAYSAGAEKIADSMYADSYTGGITEDYDITMSDCEALSKELIKALEEVCPGATKSMSFLQSLVAFEIGKTSAYDIDGKDWTPTKKKKAHARKQALKKIKEKTLDEELELALIEQRLEHVKKTRYVSYGNGKHHMEWVSPSGFPVFYHSYLSKEVRVPVTLQGVPVGHVVNGEHSGRIAHVLQEPSKFASLQSLMSGISPNFIHSQDAAHMSLVIADWNHSFGAVHDSFSTHASHVENLSHLTRQAFIDIYNKENYFEHIMDNVLTNTEGFDKEIPELGNLDITDVRGSEYFFC